MEFQEPMTVVTGPNLKSPSMITVMPLHSRTTNIIICVLIAKIPSCAREVELDGDERQNRTENQ